MRYTLRWLSIGVIILLLVAVVWQLAFMEPSETPAPPAPIPTLVALTPIATLPPSPPESPREASAVANLRAYFLDVGQGDSILLAGPDFTILIDAGRHDHDEVLPLLEEIGVERIDLLVGTHPHADHIGQFPEVLARFPVSEVWMSGDSNLTLTFERALDAVADSGAAYHEPRLGEVYQIGSARIEVLNPAELTGEPNEGSVSLRLIYGDVAFMFTGDAEEATEEAIIASGRDLRAQILKLGHHGSNTSSSLPFLQAVDPELAIWSAGIDNTYGHPSPETLTRLEELGVPVLGTAIDSTIVVVTDGERFEVEDFGPINDIVPTPPTPIAVAGCLPGQININTASLAKLQEIEQIGPTRARELVNLRPFHSIEDLDRVPGIGASAIARIKAQGLACVE